MVLMMSACDVSVATINKIAPELFFSPFKFLMDGMQHARLFDQHPCQDLMYVITGSSTVKNNL